MNKSRKTRYIFIPRAARMTRQVLEAIGLTSVVRLLIQAGAARKFRDLNERYAIVICTAAMEFPNTIMPKIEWLNEHFPFLDPHLFVFCGYKQVMGTDYLIDDSPKHFPSFKGTPLLYSAVHNLEETQYERVSSWAEIGDYFAKKAARDFIAS